MHGKEKALAPILREALGVHVVVPGGLDTDSFGTFTGEVGREADVLSVLRSKCRMAMKMSGTDLAVASEGSFGAHPYIPFLPADEERLLLCDSRHGLEIQGGVLSSETNYSSGSFSGWEAVEAFARSAGFPDHGLILRTRKTEGEEIVKGITDHQQLRRAFDMLQQVTDTVHVETDMRAMMNPMRMKVIAQAANDLVERIRSVCPQCGRPGFGVVRTDAGLPCRQCRMPTRSVLRVIYFCNGCGNKHEVLNPGGRSAEDPMHCDWCNP